MASTAKRKSKNTETTTGDTLAVEPDVSELSLVSSNPLSEWGGDFELSDFEDGYGENDAEDQRLGSIIWNVDGDKGSGDDAFFLEKSQFFDTIDETAVERIKVVFLYKKKSLLFSERDEEGKRLILCRSYDRKKGEPTQEGRDRFPSLNWRCETCPKSRWADKTPPDCASVFNVYIYNMETGQIRLMRFKKSGYRPFNDYLNKHHTGKILTKAGRRNVPLCVYEVEISLERKSKPGIGTYYVPVLSRGRLLSKGEAQQMSELAKTMREHEKALRELDEFDTSAEGDDTSFDFGDNDDKPAANEGDFDQF